MRIGAIFPQTDIGSDPHGARDFAQAIYALGFEHIAAFDHVLGADASVRPGWRGYDANSMFHEPFLLFAYLTAFVPRLELVTSVIILPQRETALVAKQAAELDVLTNGNFRLGVGVGWNPVEYEALGQDFSKRGRRFEEQITLMRRLWTERVVTFEGKFDKVLAAGINPLPVQQPIPIWIGGSAERALRRAARMADGYFTQRPLEGMDWAQTFEQLRGWLREAGRDPSAFGIEARVAVGRGTPDDWRREVEEWRALGATHVTVNTLGAGLQGPQAHIDRMREVAQALLK
jgi:probable F420-dependent oxidoreductase